MLETVISYNKSDQYYDKPEGIQICGCMGPGYGEPYCPCNMARAGLPMSAEHVIANDQSIKEWEAFFNSGGFRNLGK